MNSSLESISRIAALGILTAAVCLAQPAADPMAALRQTAEKKSTDWDTLARALDGKIQRVPPCDPRVKQAIEEVRLASEGRLAALSEVLRAAVVQATADTQRVKDALAAEDNNLRESNADRADTEQERVAANAELADLKETAKRRDGFDDALKKLGEISDRTDGRGENSNRAVEQRVLFSATLRDLLAANQKRQEALNREQTALAAEAAAWTQYYAAREARAETECSIVGGAPKPPARRRKR